MKKLLSMISCVLILATCAMGVQAQTAACDECYDFTVLTGNQTTNRTLTTGTDYLLRSCYVIDPGVTLTIQPGVRIFGEAATKGMLIVDTGAVLIADGQPNSMVPPDPIIFTSCRPVDEREPGDWGGVTILGRAENNSPTGLIELERCSTTYYAGRGNNPINNENSGILRYVQIHYAGQGNVGDDEVHGLTLVSVGSGTTLEHVQVVHSLTNGFMYIGGTVNSKYLTGYNNRWTDFWYTYGYNGLGQFLLSLRMDPAVYDNVNPQLSNGILAENNDIGPGFTGSPLTNPILSNVSIFGPLYCDDEANTGAIKGVTFQNNTGGSIYNSFTGGYPTGLFIQDNLTIVNAQNDLINFGYSSFYQNTNHFVSSPANFDPNNDFCVSTITDWMTGSGLCVEEGNDILFGVGYHSSICNQTYCGSGNRPEFVLSDNDMEFPDFSADVLDNPFFETDNDGVEYRGALAETDWTEDWTDWCAQETNYCPELRQRKSGSNTNGRLRIVPNPASGTSYALFDAEQTGKVQVSVRDKVSGQVLRSSSSFVSDASSQRVAIPANGLQAGVYIVQVVLPDGSVLSGQLFVL